MNISIIIPAHNEAKVIAHSLYELTRCGAALNPEIIVVCNGCSDNTAEVVRDFGGAVTCIETDVASKTHALNIGDEAASHFPRFYLDADIRLSLMDIEKVVNAMELTHALAAAPRMQMDLSGSSWAVRSYYEIWCNLPYCREGMIGAGVYALSEEGRQSFKCFPNIIADDRYIRALFTGDQRIGVKDAVSVISAPTRLSGLIKIKTRSRLGGYEFESRFPELLGNETKEYGQAAGELLGEIRLWPKALLYLAVNLLTRVRARRQGIVKGFSHWERDDSSREKFNR
ncbi:glycosyltransferase [Mariprofundus ferrooxydans]|uniref:glycosyltransferase n=1 Tax=Mariprofundus ferrooxydans TaxID=314344 RepID=UPI0003710610|nr:glycosyltransferase [Mariprofundus ferrooxydans]